MANKLLLLFFLKSLHFITANNLQLMLHMGRTIGNHLYSFPLPRMNIIFQPMYLFNDPLGEGKISNKIIRKRYKTALMNLSLFQKDNFT